MWPRTSHEPLRVVGELPSDLPDGGWLMSASSRRPGDRLEHISLDAADGIAVEQLALRVGLESNVVLALAVEGRALLERVGDRFPDAVERLDAQAHEATTVRRALAAAEADYLRLLMWGARKAGHRPIYRPPDALPVRLLARLAHGRAALNPDEPITSYVAWEAAALLCGQMMTEWALYRLLAAVP